MSRTPSAAGLWSIISSRALPANRSRVADFVALTKPKIVLLELATVVVAAHLASPAGVAPWTLLHTVIGAALVAASAGAFNQWWERTSDAKMARTADRPLPAGRLTAREVVWFGTLCLLIGVAELSIFTNWRTALVGLATWFVYVLVYTPLKLRSPLNTAVGAVSGALPILIGWTAAGAAIDMQSLALTSVIFLWQFPHFMAIAWLYREDYANAGQQMLTVVDPTGMRAGAQAVVGALALLPVSLVPALSPLAGSPLVYCAWALLLAVGLVAAAVLFMIRRDDRSARVLLRARLVYLICWMGLLLIVAV
jgi:protoheme IX farnesyltransferase